jgi:checkpoint serine/threonine-protein kinase
VLAEERAAADAAAAAREAKKNRTASRRRLDATGAGPIDSSASLTNEPVSHHETDFGNAAFVREKPRTRLYSPFVPSDTVDARGGEVSYEEIRARRWKPAPEVWKVPPAAPEPEPGPIVAPRAFATSTATTEMVPEMVSPRASSESPRSRPVVLIGAAPHSGGSCDSPPPDAGSGVAGRGEARTDEARGSGLAPAAPAAAAPAAAVVPAGLRWTATEGGTYGAEPTMTLCTKEAWGDIMSMFSDGPSNDAEGEKTKTKVRSVEPDPELPVSREALEGNATANAFEGLNVREDTRFSGLEIREDTVVIPSAPVAPRNPAARAASENGPSPTVSAGRNSAAPRAESSDGDLDVYQDTAFLDAAAVAAIAGVGSHGSASLGARRPLDGWRAPSADEPSANGPDEFEAYDDARNAFAENAENAPPSGHHPLRDFVPRSIAAAAAAAAVLQPLPLDLRSELVSENAEANAEANAEEAETANARFEARARAARAQVGFRGEDDFEVYADDETERVSKVLHAIPGPGT